MRLLAFDVETSGLDPKKDRVIEFGWAVWDTDLHAPLMVRSFLCQPEPDEPLLTAEIQKLTGITPGLRSLGHKRSTVLPTLLTDIVVLQPERVVAHNARFDRAFLFAEYARQGAEAPTVAKAPWIDTMNHLPFAAPPVSRRLPHLAADHGFINPFAHRAVFDALTACLLLDRYPLEEVLRRADSPNVIVRADVSYDDRDKAKVRRYSWERIDDGGKTYPKLWVKRLSKLDLAAEQKDAGFPVRVLEEEAE